MQKNYNQYFLLAQEWANKPFLAYSYEHNHYDKIEKLAYKYAKNNGDKMICLSDYENVLKLEYVTRLSSLYAKRIMRKLKRIKKFLNVHTKDSYALTLTLDPKRFISFKHAYVSIQKAWNKLNLVLKRRGMYAYVKVVEFQHDTHMPHLHIIMLTKSRIDINEIREIWNKRYGMGIFVRIDKILRNGAGNYFFKYITKYESDSKDRLNDNNIMAWALKARTYSISKALLSLITLKTNSTHKWFYICTLPIELWDRIITYQDLIDIGYG